MYNKYFTMITKHFQKVNKTFWIVIRRSSTFEHFPSSSPLMHKWRRRKKSWKTQSNDHRRVVSRGQKKFLSLKKVQLNLSLSECYFSQNQKSFTNCNLNCKLQSNSTDVGKLDILFHQITMFTKVHVVFNFWASEPFIDRF